MHGIDEGAEGPDLYRHLVAELDTLGLAYLHVLQQGNDELLADLRKLWRGALILNRPGRPREQIGQDAKAGLADLEAYGQMVLANPDFIERIKVNAPLNEAHSEGFYGGTERFYTDYPTMSR